MPWKSNGGDGWKSGGGPWGSGGGTGGGAGDGKGPGPDIEDLLKKGQETLRSKLPGGGLKGKGIIILLILGLIGWSFSGFYRVQPDEQGVVLRFGKFVKLTQPGLNYHLPVPIESAITPKVTRVNRIDIGLKNNVQSSGFGRSTRTSAQDVPEESLMLTGDENIVDVDFAVFWVINDASKFLFNIQNPVNTVKEVAESAMREIVGRSDIQPILTGARAKTEAAVQELIQNTLNEYNSGISITQVQLQKVDPPIQVIDAFRDVQAARADQERLRNEAEAYANRVIPEARGDAARITQAAEAYKQQTVAQAIGQAARFKLVYDEYRKAPGVTRERMFLETMERVFKDKNKVIIDNKIGGGQGVVPYLPLNELTKKKSSGAGQ